VEDTLLDEAFGLGGGEGLEGLGGGVAGEGVAVGGGEGLVEVGGGAVGFAGDDFGLEGGIVLDVARP